MSNSNFGASVGQGVSKRAVWLIVQVKIPQDAPQMWRATATFITPKSDQTARHVSVSKAVFEVAVASINIKSAP